MARRYDEHRKGERYLANTSSSGREIHDLDHETIKCQIDQIITSADDKVYLSLDEANAEGYRSCVYCIGNSTRYK